MGALLPPVMGSLVSHRRRDRVRRVYVSGDTLMGEHVNEIARRHPDVNIAVVHLGGTRVLWHTVTMDAVQGVEFASTIRARRTIPVHYDDYRVFRSSLPEFLARARLAGAGGTDIRPVRVGETVSLTPMEPRPA